jgi:hypothetical protein
MICKSIVYTFENEGKKSTQMLIVAFTSPVTSERKTHWEVVVNHFISGGEAREWKCKEEFEGQPNQSRAMRIFKNLIRNNVQPKVFHYDDAD